MKLRRLVWWRHCGVGPSFSYVKGKNLSGGFREQEALFADNIDGTIGICSPCSMGGRN